MIKEILLQCKIDIINLIKNTFSFSIKLLPILLIDMIIIKKIDKYEDGRGFGFLGFKIFNMIP